MALKNSEGISAPLVVHIVFRFDYGGLENGVVNVINGLVDAPLRHAVVALSEATEFAERLRDDVEVFSIGKKPGKDLKAYVRLYRLLRKLKPEVVHTRNLGTIDCALVAFLARVPIRIHGEHGWDVFDPDGVNRKYRLARRCLTPFINTYVTVSQDLQSWLINIIGISPQKVKHICNGVDTQRFRPSTSQATAANGNEVVIGSVTRFSEIKDPLNLINAYAELRLAGLPIHLLMVGDGELMKAARSVLADTQTSNAATLTGSRDDIPEQLRKMDVFVLGSLREGISNTILEAMSTGLPVIASNTGGNPELIEAGITGELVPPGDGSALASAICDYVQDSERRVRHGLASRDRVSSLFSIDRMVENYRALYLESLATQGDG